MSKFSKLLIKVLSGTSDKNIVFSDLCKLLSQLGFDMRIWGDHHIFTKDGVEEILNLQPIGNNAKAYQVKQVRTVILKHKLGGQDDNAV
ncbi:MAG: type II toxin-antitoxin system HicA family toxin [Elainellaceae cyanobacterium]